MIAEWLTAQGLAWLVQGLPWVGATVLAVVNIDTVRGTWSGAYGSSVVTWSIWAALAGIALSAQLGMGGWTAAAVLLVPVVGVATAVAVGAAVRYRDQQPGVWWQPRVDLVCGAGALASLTVLLYVDDHTAIVLTMVTDLIAAVPTITMAWWPAPEQPVPTTPFVSLAVASACTLAAAPAEVWQWLYPAYSLGFGITLTAIIMARRSAPEPEYVDSDAWLAPAWGQPLRPPPTWRDGELIDSRPPNIRQANIRDEQTITTSTQRRHPVWMRRPSSSGLARFAPAQITPETLRQVHAEAWRCGWHDRERALRLTEPAD